MAGGGIAPYVTVLADVLRRIAEVTIVTSASYEPKYHELKAELHPGLPHPDVRLAFVPDPEGHEVGSFFSSLHLYSARVYERLKQLFPDGGPDVVEFSDYLGEGAVTTQAVRTHDPALRNTTVVVKLHTTAEVVHLLDGWVDDAVGARATYELERYSLRYADALLYGGGDVYGTYERFYGRRRLAPGQVVRQPVIDAPAAEQGVPSEILEGDAPVRFLYFGRFERRKGVQNLARAVMGSSSDRFTLTMVGGDTQTGPLGASLRDNVALTVAGDERVRLLGQVDPRDVPALLADHDAIVVPSLWECWPNVALEALRANRPLLATPVGGLAEMAGEGPGDRAGWHVRDTGVPALRDALERLSASPAEIAEVVALDGPRRRFEALVEREGTLRAYEALAERRRERRERHGRSAARRARRPLVSVVVPYFRLEQYVGETVESLLGQTYPELEVLVVNDGSLREEDRVLERLAARLPIEVVTQPNSGLGAARNFGIRLARGRYVLPFDADDLLDPSFVARCVEVLEEDRAVSYVTSWIAYMNEEGRPDERFGDGWHPISNDSILLDDVNTAGSALALFRREVFEEVEYETDLTSYEDWLFYQELQVRGLFGHVIPERLVHYRLRASSMLRTTGVPSMERIHQERRAHFRRNRVRWTSPTA